MLRLTLFECLKRDARRACGADGHELGRFKSLKTTNVRAAEAACKRCGLKVTVLLDGSSSMVFGPALALGCRRKRAERAKAWNRRGL